MSNLKDPEGAPRVKVALGFTKTEDFDSLRFDIGVEVDARPGENWEDAITRLHEEMEPVFVEHFRQTERLMKG